MSRADEHSNRVSGFASVAITGTFWTSAQTLVNKFATLFSTWIIARKLTQDEVGAGALALTITKFLVVLPPLNMGDVLIAAGSRRTQFLRVASSLAIRVGLATTCLLILFAPVVASLYSQYPFQLLTLLVVLASVRPIAEALQVENLTRLRLDFRNRTLALMDGGMQLSMTFIAIALAIAGAGAWVIVIPPVAIAIGKALAYSRAANLMKMGASIDLVSPPRRTRLVSTLACRRFTAAGSAQYIHSVVDSLPILILGKLAAEAQTGIYAFALSLSGQANSLITVQLSGVLQPVLSRLAHDPARQIDGFLRAMRVTSALAIPACVTQAAFSEALFGLVFDSRWQSAAPIVTVLSVCEAFFFASAPTMAMLKAQGRFRAFLVWQSTQLALAIVVLPLATVAGDAFGVALAVTILWAVGLPTAVWIAIRNVPNAARITLGIFLIPWSTALPLGGLAWWAGGHLHSLGTAGGIAALAVLAPGTFIAMAMCSRWTQPTVHSEILRLSDSVLRRLPVVRKFRT